MSSEKNQKAAELQKHFDQAFSKPVRSTAEQEEKCLAIKIRDDVFALRFSEIKGLETAQKVTSFPYPKSEFMGLAGIKGKLTPVFNLERCLGYHDHETKNVKWFVLCSSKNEIVLAFDNFLGYVSVPRSNLFQAKQDAQQKEHAAGVFHMESKVGFIIDIASIIRKLAISVS